MLSPERINRLAELEMKLDYVFKDKNLLNKALTHKSYVNEKVENLKNNERFEFLGDSVLDLVVGEHLVKNYPEYSEGRLSKIRASVVNETCLAEIASLLNLGEYLLLGKGEDLSGGRHKNSILANTFEAVAGGVFCDSNLETASKVFWPCLMDKIAEYGDSHQFKDFKSELQEFTQMNRGCVPSYHIVNETGPDHEKTFEVAVEVDHKALGSGKGRTKKEAEQAAAKIALEKLT